MSQDRKMVIAILFVTILSHAYPSQRYGEKVVYFEAMTGQIARGKVSPTKFSLYLRVNCQIYHAPFHLIEAISYSSTYINAPEY